MVTDWFELCSISGQPIRHPATRSPPHQPDGEVRVGHIFDEEPHLLFGPDESNDPVFFSPNGKRIGATGDHDVRLWPMPDLSKPPLHTLPYDELLDKLRAPTNLRVIPYLESTTGYEVEPDFSAYRGRAEVPEW